MKIGGGKKVHYDAGPNMTPLVDVVMVILIFLMLAGSLAGENKYLVSNTPFTGQGSGEVSKGQLDEPLNIRVDVNLNSPSGWSAKAGGLPAVGDINSLAAQLSSLRQKLEKVGKPSDKVQVIIGPGINVKYQDLIAVYQAALKAQFQKVSFNKAH